MINISCYLISGVYTNCYLLEDTQTGDLLVIDPGGENRALLDRINKAKGKLRYILLTHGHYDHIMYVHELEKLFSPVICVGEIEKPLIENGTLNNFDYYSYDIKKFDIDKALKDGDEISFGGSNVKFMLTPGHTAGSGIYIMDNCIFSGDTIFRTSVGRCDLPTGDPAQMMKSLERISSLKGDYTIYPGHDRETSLDFERKHNPYFP